MASLTIRTLPDAEAVSLAAAAEFVRVAAAAIQTRDRFTVVLSGGSTPRRLYEILASAPFRAQLDWSKVEFFWGDERAVPPDHEDSNYAMASKAMLLPLAIAPARIHRMQAEREDLELAAREYEAEIARVFRVRGDVPPTFDLILLGMGADGHTASLFPFTATLKESTRWVVPNYVPKLSAYRLTMTAPLINHAARVLFLVAGADKAAALAEVLQGPADPDRLPSQRIRPQSGELLWLLDQAASSQLK